MDNQWSVGFLRRMTNSDKWGRMKKRNNTSASDSDQQIYFRRIHWSARIVPTKTSAVQNKAEISIVCWYNPCGSQVGHIRNGKSKSRKRAKRWSAAYQDVDEYLGQAAPSERDLIFAGLGSRGRPQNSALPCLDGNLSALDSWAQQPDLCDVITQPRT